MKTFAVGPALIPLALALGLIVSIALLVVAGLNQRQRLSKRAGVVILCIVYGLAVVAATIYMGSGPLGGFCGLAVGLGLGALIGIAYLHSDRGDVK